MAEWKARWRGRLEEWWPILATPPWWILAFVWRSLLVQAKFIAITGSFGNTTSKDCLAAILSSVARNVATAGTQNGRTGITAERRALEPQVVAWWAWWFVGSKRGLDCVTTAGRTLPR